MTDDRLLDEGEAAEALRLSPATLRTWRSRGAGPAYVKCGRRVRYRPSDLRDYAEQNRECPAPAGMFA